MTRRYTNSSSLTHRQQQILAMLCERKQWRISDVATALGRTHTAASRMVDRLVEKGMVSCEVLPEDRRVSIIRVLPQGEAHAAALPSPDAPKALDQPTKPVKRHAKRKEEPLRHKAQDTGSASLTIRQQQFLAVLRERKQWTIKGVAAALDISNASASKMIDRLAQKHLVVREPFPENRRYNIIRLLSEEDVQTEDSLPPEIPAKRPKYRPKLRPKHDANQQSVALSVANPLTNAPTLTIYQQHILAVLRERKQWTMGEVAIALDLSYARASKMVDRLEQKRLVVREQPLEDEDQRFCVIRVLPQGEVQEAGVLPPRDHPAERSVPSLASRRREVLALLQHKITWTIEEVAEALGLAPTATVGLLARLEQGGKIIQEEDPRDRQIRIIHVVQRKRAVSHS